MHNHIILPNTPILIKEVNSTQASYAIEPLNPGYGVTIANSLRRVMLSSLEGVAVTHYKIKGVDHEFSTIPNVLEDVIDITLNIKALRFTLTGKSSETLVLKAQGNKVVTGADIKLPAGVTLVNPENPILTITNKDTKIEIELVIEKGFGFRKEADQANQAEVGLIAVDSIFTPVTRVSYDVEDMRVGDKTNYNKVIFHITTDGTISPLDVITESSAILVEQFSALSGGVAEVSPIKEDMISDTDVSVETSSIKIETLALPQRTIKALQDAGINNVAQLAQFTKKDLVELKGITAKSVEKITEQALVYDITLA
jgi:DNA-directed RNA polymerase subunit alpha